MVNLFTKKEEIISATLKAKFGQLQPTVLD
jgi:hypothetical protein